MSSGIILGAVNQTPVRFGRGTFVLPIASSQSLTHVNISGNTFQLTDTGNYVLTVNMLPSGSEMDTPFSLAIYDETAGAIVSQVNLTTTPQSSPVEQTFTLPLTVADATHFYSLRLIAAGGQSQAYAVSLSGLLFQIAIQGLGGGGGGGGVTAVTASQPLTSSGGTTPNLALGTAVAPIAVPDATADVAWSPSGTGKKALVIQEITGQTRSAIEVQSANGMTIFGVPAVPGLTGANNVIAGSQAGAALTAGADNTFLGKQAGTGVTTGVGNTLIGSQAGSVQVTANHCTGVGFNALSHNTGNNNNAVGYNAMSAVGNAGSYNNAFGSGAMAANTSGYINTAFGDSALNANTIGGYNTAIGAGALKTGTSGYNNTAVGANALQNATGNNNTAVGDVCFGNPSGHDNSGLGYRAGNGWQGAGNGNVAIGSQAAATSFPTPPGNNNVAIGFRAAIALSAGASSNTFVGAYSCGGSNNPSCSGNVAIGCSACNNVTTGSANTVIGASAASSLTTGGSNVIIGSSADVNSSGTATAVAIGAGANGVAAGVVIGGNAGNHSASGSQTTVVGYAAGTSLSSGANNTLIGASAGNNIAAGASNVAVGFNSLTGATSGASNVAIGSGAAGALTTGGSNVVIGASANVNAATDTNEIVIGASTTGAGSNTAVIGNASLTDVYLGSAAAKAKLHSANVFTSSFILTAPNGALAATPLWRAAVNIHVKAIHVLCIGGTNIIGNCNSFDANGGTATALDSDLTCLAGTTNNDVLSSPVAITAGQFIGWHTTSVSGSPSSVVISFDYTID